MSDIGMICVTVLALILAGAGLHKIAFERGYVHGYEDATHPITVTVEDDE